MGNLINKIVFTPRQPFLSKSKSDYEIQFFNWKSNKVVYTEINNRENSYDTIIIYSYGNCESINSVYSFCKSLANKTGTKVIIYEYPGFGLNFNSDPSPTERRIKEYSLAVTDLIFEKYPESRIVHYGRSLGSGPACYACYKRPKVSGLVLESAFTTIFHTIVNCNFHIYGDLFRNIDIIGKIDTPLLLIHGLSDRIVPYHHAVELQKNSKNVWGTLFLKNGSHNNLDSLPFRNELFFKLFRFVKMVETI